MSEKWLAGVSEVEITPPLGVEMTGFGNRPGPAADILDSLYVRALALCHGGRKCVLVSLDLLGLDQDLIRRIRSLVTVRDGLPPEALLLNCTHTHAGPATQSLRGLGRRDPHYCDLVCRWSASAVSLALSRLAPAAIGFFRGPCQIGENRRERREGRIVLGSHPAGAYDPWVYGLRVRTPAGRSVATWFAHAAHPVTLGTENTGISGDFPGVAALEVSRRVGGVSLFAQGCCGDINPLRRGGYEEVAATGSDLAACVEQALGDCEPAGEGIAFAMDEISLPQMRPGGDEAEAAVRQTRENLDRVKEGIARGELPEYRKLLPRAMTEWAADYRSAAAEAHEPSTSITVQAIRLGEVAIVGTSGETFVAIGQQIQERSPFSKTVVLGYTNGCLGYVPTRRAFEEGGYEVETAFKYYGTLMLTDGCEDAVISGAERQLRRL